MPRTARNAPGVRRAEQWRWGSCHVRRDLLSDWPLDRPRGWLETVHLPPDEAGEKMVQECIERSRPLGSDRWVKATARQLSLEHTLRPRGRPQGWKKDKAKSGGSPDNGSRHF